MITFIKNTISTDKHSKLFEWVKLVMLTGSGQVVVQASGFISGIIILRLLPTHEYALYTLANTFLGTMTMLADSGISSGVMAEGGKVWQDKKKLGAVLATGLNLRYKFGLITLVCVVPLMAYFLTTHGASLFTTVLIIFGIIPAFFASLSDSFLEMAPKLHQDIKPLQKNQAEVSIGRLVLSALFLSIFPFTIFAIVASSIPRIYGNYKLSRISSKFASAKEEPDAKVKKEVVKGVSRTLPIVLYHCVSGQITIWLVTFLGTTTNISEIGALGRISVIFNLFTVLFSTLIIPRFSRMPPDRGKIMQTFSSIQLITLTISIILLALTYFFANQILWILGSNYIGLKYELLLMGASSCVGLMAGICSQLVISRGWFIKPYYLIGINFTSTVIGLTFFNIKSLIGVLHFNIIVTVIGYLLVLVYGFISIKKMPELHSGTLKPFIPIH